MPPNCWFRLLLDDLDDVGEALDACDQRIKTGVPKACAKAMKFSDDIGWSRKKITR